MSHLVTDWLCIATEGDTVDGRKIYREWIIDMGETYNFNHYAARLWPEHERDWGTCGEVREARWEDGEDGLARLYAKISPSMSLIYANRDDQLVFFSIEPEEDWRGSGRTYLKGLAVTDSPASVGTTRLRFSSRRNKPKSGYYPCVITSDKKFKQEADMSNWQKLFGIKPKQHTFAEGDDDNTPGSDEKLQALAEAVNAIEQRLAAVEEAVNNAQGDIDTIAEVVDTQEFASLRENLPTILTNFSKLDKKVTKLPQRQFGDKSKSSGKFNFI